VSVLLRDPAGHPPVEILGHELMAVADAQHGDAEGIDAGIDAGDVGSVTLAGPPEMMMPRAPASSRAGRLRSATIACTPSSRYAGRSGGSTAHRR
jgi:hypothetical protein